MTQIWLAVDEDETEVVCDYELTRDPDCNGWEGLHRYKSLVELPKGTIEKIIGRKLTWDDEAVEVSDDLFENIE